MDNELIPQVVVETASYQKASARIWDENEQKEFVTYIGLNPLEGDIIPGTGGIRKIRWQSSGHGKRSGSRVIYYVYDENHPVYLLFVYPKNVQVNLSEYEKKLFSKLTDTIKNKIKNKERE